MNTLYIGLLGAFILVLGAGWPVKTGLHPAKTAKSWLLAIGAAGMFVYALLNYLSGGVIFFMILQALVVIASILMLLNTPNKINTPLIIASGTGLIIWSITLFEDYTPLIFIFGLLGIAFGYVLKPYTFKGNVSLTMGSVLIVIFSYLAKDWIFLSLNSFFAVFSAYYVGKLWK